ncbi:MAG: DinB family protein [Chitinophagaceae bacterium]|nr:DinB family protein [Chitinophagaceae bacterium]
MTAEKLNTAEIFLFLDKISFGFLQLLSAADEGKINTIPFKDSWTAAQLASHIIKSNKAIAQALHMEGKDAERDPAKRVDELKGMFLDYTRKFQSPEFTTPKQGIYQKKPLVADLVASADELKALRNKVKLSEMISLPSFGEITKLELIYFVQYHTQRHLHQLKNILHVAEKIRL